MCALGCEQNPHGFGIFSLEFSGVSSPQQPAEMSKGGYPLPGTPGAAVTRAGEPPAAQVTQAPVTSPPRRSEAPPCQSARRSGVVELRFTPRLCGQARLFSRTWMPRAERTADPQNGHQELHAHPRAGGRFITTPT